MYLHLNLPEAIRFIVNTSSEEERIGRACGLSITSAYLKGH